MRFANTYDKYYPIIQKVLRLTMLFLALGSVIVFPVSPSVGLIPAIIYKIALFFVLVMYLTVLTGAPILWVSMIEHAPGTMARLFPWRILFSFWWQFIAQLCNLIIRLYSRFSQKRLFRSNRYSFASVFSITHVPYRLYSLSCCLLE